MEEKTHSKSTEDVEKLLQDAIDEAEDGTSADCREVNCKFLNFNFKNKK